jgi:antirestriction protein ArdC
MELSIEEVIDGLTELAVKPRRLKDESVGLYDPATSTIFYDPRKLRDEQDFYTTILHELGHHTLMDNWDDELLVEDVAVRSLNNPEIKDYLTVFFYDEVEKYFK